MSIEKFFFYIKIFCFVFLQTNDSCLQKGSSKGLKNMIFGGQPDADSADERGGGVCLMLTITDRGGRGGKPISDNR